MSKLHVGFVFVLLLAVCKLQAQDKSNTIKPFKIVIALSENGVQLQKIEGSDWKNLRISFKANETKMVDEWGETTPSTETSKTATGLADFLIAISKTSSGFELKGLKGTSWETLSLNASESQFYVIEQTGLKSMPRPR